MLNLQIFIALKSRNYFGTSLKQCKYKNGEKDHYALIKQSPTLIKLSPTPIKQFPTLIKQSPTLIEG